MRRRLTYALGVTALVCAALAATAYVAAQQVGTTRYVYDANGRLQAVISPTGEATVYEYDAAGNVVSVSRRTMTATSVVGFSPVSGHIASSVTIYGTGYSTNAGENVVTFNGVAAAVTSASATEIVATVPVGATDGPITVTSPSGTATSAAPFLVIVPVITQFSPFVGPVGSTVNIKGRNFEIGAADNVVKFNGVVAALSSAIETDIEAVVPAEARPGKISVTTPRGTAVSGGDFFVTPWQSPSEQVEVTGRMAFGESRRITLTDPNKIALIIFDGAEGQRVRLRLSRAELQSCDVYLIAPNQEELVYLSADSSGGFTDAVALPEAGTYTIVLLPTDNHTGAVTLSLHDVGGVGAITPGGPPVTLAVTSPARDAHLTFNAVAGQRVSLSLSGVTIPSGALYFYQPGGRVLLSRPLAGEDFVDAMTLPYNGTYTIFLDPEPAAEGAATLTLYEIEDVTGSLSLGGPPLEVATSSPGQNALISFHADAGEVPTLNVSNVTFPGDSVFTVSGGGASDFTGGGGQPIIPPFTVGAGGGSISLGQITHGGTYKIHIDPQGPGVGGMTLSLNRPPDVTGTLVVDGPPVVVQIPVIGQNALLSFQGEAGQRVTLQASEVTIPNSFVSILRPDGTALISSVPVGAGGGRRIDNITLPATGTYAVVVDPSGTGTGSITLALSTSLGVIVPGGPPVTVNITEPGGSTTLTFQGTAGQRVSLLLSEISLYGGTLSIKKPDGTLLFPARYIGYDDFIDAQTLPDTGTYTILITAPEWDGGGVTLTLYDATEISGTIVPGGPQASVAINTPGQNARLTFSGTAGQRVSLNVSELTILVLGVSVVSPDGTILGATEVTPFGPSSFLPTLRSRDLGSATAFDFAPASGPAPMQGCCIYQGFIDTLTLPVSGTYTVYLDPLGYATGSVTLSLYDVPADVTGQITPDGPAVSSTVTVPGQNARLTFEATAGQRMILHVDDSTLNFTNVSFYNPDGTRGVDGNFYTGGGGLIESGHLPADGTYTILSNPTGISTGDITLRLVSVPDDVTAEITAGGPPVTVTTTAAGQNARLTFDATAGQKVSLNLNGGTIPSGYFSVLRPDGTSLMHPTHFYQTGSFYRESPPLPTTGTYTIFVNPELTFTGSATLTLYDTSDVTGTIEVNGPSVTVNTAIPGQNARLTFNGTAGQWLRLTVVSTTVPRTQSFSPPAFIHVLAPDGTHLGGLGNFSTAFDPLPLPVNGTYTITVDPLNNATGSTTLRLSEVPPVGSISIDGPPLNVTTQTGRISRLTFNGTAGQSMSLTATTFWGTQVSIYSPEMALVSSVSLGRFSLGSAFTGPLILPSTGTYHVAVTSPGSSDGYAQVTVTLKTVTDITGTITPDGTPATVTFTTPGQKARLTFDGVAAQRLTLNITDGTVYSSYVNILKPDGTALLPFNYYFFGSNGAFIETPELPDTGTYTLVLDPEYVYTGNITVSLSVLPPDATGDVEVNGPPLSLNITAPGQKARATFTGAEGQLVTVTINASGITDCVELNLTTPDGYYLSGDYRCGDGIVEFAGVTLPSAGVYAVNIDPARASTGSFVIAVQPGEGAGNDQ